MITAFYQSLSPRWQTYAPYILLVLAVFLAYCNVYTNDFLFDDGLIITRNELLHHWSSFGHLLTASTTEGAHISGGFYRPVQMVLYFIVYQLGGESLFGFHLLNVLIHAANACLVYELGKRLKFHNTASFFAALIWAVHPLHTEAVTYMSSTADTLHVFFCLLGLVYLLPDFAPRKFFLVIPIFLLGLFSKEVSIVFPALVVCCLYLTSNQSYEPKTYIKTWPLWVVAGIYTAWRLTTTSLDGPASYAHVYQQPAYYSLKLYSEHFSFRLYTFLATLPSYAALVAWPTELHMERTFNVFAEFWLTPVLIGALMVAAAGAQIIFNRNEKYQPLSWGLLWFGASHFPDSGLLVPVNALFLEHWMYLPTIGLFLGIAQIIALHIETSRYEKLKPAITGICLIIATALGTATFFQNRVWHDPVTFYTHVFHYGVTSARAHNNLALAYMERREYALAIDEYHKAIETSDTYAETRHNLAVSLLNLPDKEKHIEEAVDNLNRALEIDPNFYRSYIVLSQIYAFLGDKDKADLNREKAEKILNSYEH